VQVVDPLTLWPVMNMCYTMYWCPDYDDIHTNLVYKQHSKYTKMLYKY